MTRQRGFGAIAAIVVLVILALLAAAIVALSTNQQLTAAQDIMSAKAWQAARAGNEWGLYKALKDGSCIAAPGTTLDLSADTGFHVTVTCVSNDRNEGETSPGTPRVVRIFRVTAVACPAATCPVVSAAVAGVGYIERTREVLATDLLP